MSIAAFNLSKNVAIQYILMIQSDKYDRDDCLSYMRLPSAKRIQGSDPVVWTCPGRIAGREVRPGMRESIRFRWGCFRFARSTVKVILAPESIVQVFL